MRSVANQDAVMIGYPADGSVQGPRAFDLDARVATDDGLGPRPVLGTDATLIGYFSDDGRIADARPLVLNPAVCTPAPPDPGPCTDVELPTIAIGPRGKTPSTALREIPAGTYWAAPWSDPDSQGNRMVIVDAAAEAHLLDLSGHPAAADAFRVLAKSSPADSLPAVIDRLSGAATEEAKALVEAKDQIPAYLQNLADGAGRQVDSLTAVPLLATSVGSASLSLEMTARPYRRPVTRLDIEVDPVDPRNPTAPRGLARLPVWALPEGGPAAEGDSAKVDVSGRFGGLGLGVTVVPVPGLSTGRDPVLSYASPRLSLVEETRTLTRPASDDGTLGEMASLESASGTLPGRSDVSVSRALPASTSRESAYYVATDDGRRFSDGDAPLLVSVGTITPDPNSAVAGAAPLLTDVELPTTLVADPDGTPRDTRLRPSSTGFGLANQMPAAYVDAASSKALGLERPFSTVRVRVAGVGTDLTPDNLARIDRVAEGLRSAGFAVTTVAASSLSPRQMEVVSYRFADGSVPRPLGTVEQFGPELEASQRVSAAIGSAGLANTLTVLATLGVLAVLCVAAAVPARRHRARLLAVQGWSTRATTALHLREDALTLTILALTVAGVGVVALQPGRLGAHPLLLTAGVGVTLVLAMSTIAACIISGRSAFTKLSPARGARSARAADSLGALVARWTLRSVPRIVVDAACRCAIAVGGALMVAALLRARREAGASILAAGAVSQDLPFHVGLGALTVAVGVMLLVQMHRVEGQAVRAEARLLMQHGFTRTRVLVRHLGPVVASMVSAAIAVTAVVLTTVPGTEQPLTGVAGAAMILLTTLATVRTRQSQIAHAFTKGPNS